MVAAAPVLDVECILLLIQCISDITDVHYTTCPFPAWTVRQSCWCAVKNLYSLTHCPIRHHIYDQLNEATSTFHAYGLPSDPDRSQLLLPWPGMNYQLTSATSRQLLHSRNTSRHYCLMLPMAPHSCDTPILYFTSHFIIRPIYFVKRSRPLL